MTEVKVHTCIPIGTGDILVTINDNERTEVLVFDSSFSMDSPIYGESTKNCPSKCERDDPRLLASLFVNGDPQILMEYLDQIWVKQHEGESRLKKNALLNITIDGQVGADIRKDSE